MVREDNGRHAEGRRQRHGAADNSFDRRNLVVVLGPAISGPENEPDGTMQFNCPDRLRSMALYAAYGSNMDPAQMLQRCPSSPVAGTGWLPGWRLTFGGEDLGWEGALATVVEDPASSVFVVLYDMAASDERTLDSWEGADLGLYTKIRLRVHTLDGDELAWLYALQAFEGGIPSARYLGVIADAAEAADAPTEYVREIRNRPCRSIGS